MRRKVGKSVKRAAVFMAVALAVPVPAAAQADTDSGEELKGILETQMEQGEKPLLSSTLGLEELQENMKKEGFFVGYKYNFSEPVLKLFEMEDVLSEEGYAEINLKAMPGAEKWQVDMKIAADAVTKFLDISLYGDEDQLAISIPQFYDGALAIRSGSLLKQYENSWLEGLLQAPLEEDISLSFIPDFSGQTEDSWKMVEDAVRVEKSEQGDETVYSLIVSTDAFLEFCQAQFGGLVEQLENVATVTISGDEDAFFDSLKDAMEDECVIDFHIKDSLMSEVTLETTIDMAVIEEYQKSQNAEVYMEPDTQEDTGEIIGGSDGSTDIYLPGSKDFTVKFSFAFADPANPCNGFEGALKLGDEEEMTLKLSGEREQAGNTETYTLHFLQSDTQGVNIDQDFYEASFNAETREYDEVLDFGDEYGMIGLDGTFTKIAPGKGYSLNIDALSIADETDVISMSGSLFKYAGPAGVKAPENEKMFLEMTQAQLLNLMLEFQEKSTAWEEKFMPQLSETEEYEENGGMNAEQPGYDGEDHAESPDDNDRPEAAPSDETVVA